MKNTFKLVGIIAMVAMLTLFITACDNDNGCNCGLGIGSGCNCTLGTFCTCTGGTGCTCDPTNMGCECGNVVSCACTGNTGCICDLSNLGCECTGNAACSCDLTNMGCECGNVVSCACTGDTGCTCELTNLGCECTHGTVGCECSNLVSCECEHRILFEIGDTCPAGGIVFYVHPTGFIVQGWQNPNNPNDPLNFESFTARHLSAAPTNIGTRAWATDLHLIPDLSQNWQDDDTDWGIGRGKKNTAIIIAHGVDNGYDTPAASDATALPTVGKTGWFLPSRDELYELWLRGVVDLGMQPLGWGIFWSSSQGNTQGAWTRWFNDLNENFDDPSYKRSHDLYVRAVRAF